MLLTLRRLFTLAIITLASASNAERPAEFSESVQPLILHDEERLLIHNVRVVDGTGSEAREESAVLLEDGRVIAIGPMGLVGAGDATRIDGGGRTLLPGFVMLHEHLFYPDRTAFMPNYSVESLTMAPLYLAAGTTSLRTTGTMSASDDLQIKGLIEAGRLPGPDIHATAPYLNGVGGFAHQMKPIQTAEQARRFVRYWVSEGATSFKAYREVSREVLAAAIDEAHGLGATVTGHICSVTFAEAAALGIDNIEHGPIEASDFADDKVPDVCPNMRAVENFRLAHPDRAEARALIDTLVAADVAITSTLPVFAAGVHSSIPTTDSLEILSTRSQNFAKTQWLMMLGNPEDPYVERTRNRLATEMAFEKAFVEAGGHLVIGTDPTGWGGTVPPNSTHSALVLLVEAGFSPLEAISLATQSGARFLGVDDEVGTIEIGKRANLILVDGKPDQTIEDVTGVHMVFKDGVAWDPEALIDTARGLVGR